MEYANGVRPYVLEWYYKVFQPTYNAKTTVNTKVRTYKKEEQILYESRIAVTNNELVAATKATKVLLVVPAATATAS